MQMIEVCSKASAYLFIQCSIVMVIVVFLPCSRHVWRRKWLMLDTINLQLLWRIKYVKKDILLLESYTECKSLYWSILMGYLEAKL